MANDDNELHLGPEASADLARWRDLLLADSFRVVRTESGVTFERRPVGAVGSRDVLVRETVKLGDIPLPDGRPYLTIERRDTDRAADLSLPPTDDELTALADRLGDDGAQRLYDLLYARGCRR